MSGKLLTNILTGLFGSRNERTLRELGKIVDAINALESKYEAYTDAQLRELTPFFRQQLKEGVSEQALLPETFAAVREVSKRTLGMRHFDVQLLGGLVLTRRSIAEMRTGEGKTLTATLPSYWNALSGKGVHIVTVNDYLAQRDAHLNARLFEALGMTTGVVLSHHQQTAEEKRQAYHCDITYGTSSTFAFDYLNEHRVMDRSQRIQRPLHYALLDEIDAILIDDARTPLIISEAEAVSEEDSQNIEQWFRVADSLVRTLVAQPKADSEEYIGTGHFYLEIKKKSAHLTERGLIVVEEGLQRAGLLSPGSSLYSIENTPLLHCVQACLRAHYFHRRDFEYIVRDDKVIIIDENTGRVMEGRQWQNGLQQAVEAKEHLPITVNTNSSTSITYQNFFRLYERLAGMTGTADTEAYEFKFLYQLDTIVVPTNRPMIREDEFDRLCLDESIKKQAILEDIQNALSRNQPVLVGTSSIRKSEELAEYLSAHQISYKLLNARYHEQEAAIIAQAGRPGRVTIATNMAGRGTDIILGGNIQHELEQYDDPNDAHYQAIIEAWNQRRNEVVAVGGLRVIGTDRNYSRRIDNQLRGRSGRQGDPGSSCFYVSFDDEITNWIPDFTKNFIFRELKKIFSSDNLFANHPLIAKEISRAQQACENRGFDERKSLLEYDDVINEHRKVIYNCRNWVLETEDLSALLEQTTRSVLGRAIDRAIDASRALSSALAYGETANHSMGKWKRFWKALIGLFRRTSWRDHILAALEQELGLFKLPLNFSEILSRDPKMSAKAFKEKIFNKVMHEWQERQKMFPEQMYQGVVRQIFLQSIDQIWRDHLVAMDNLQKYIHLRGYAQRDPKKEYKKEAFKMFQSLFTYLDDEIIRMLSRLSAEALEYAPRVPFMVSPEQNHSIIFRPRLSSEKPFVRQSLRKEKEGAFINIASDSPSPESGESSPMGRNDFCWCGSGLRYKHCHGKLKTGSVPSSL